MWKPLENAADGTDNTTLTQPRTSQPIDLIGLGANLVKCPTKKYTPKCLNKAYMETNKATRHYNY